MIVENTLGSSFERSVMYFVKCMHIVKCICTHVNLTFRHNSDEYDHNVCTKTEEGTGEPWPAGEYCILRYGGTCPEGMSFSLLHPWPTGQYCTTRYRGVCSVPSCIKHFNWSMELFWTTRFDVTIVSIGNKCNVKPD